MSAERFTLDTNILVYSIDRTAGLRHEQAVCIVEAAITQDCHLTLQVVSEFCAAATRKCGMSVDEAAAQAEDWLELFPCLLASDDTVRRALGCVRGGPASYWDALLVATAGEGGCTTILTEDLTDGTRLEGVRIVNPFGPVGLSRAASQILDLARHA
ncbi:Predicted nucleic acid-binding protein, contains PIN domain [Arboricoccus pini]|uniref:Predicted nucleic acid-binding protein, contains PIN domain n=1 Tax=Arboricoccus pini TaxID=1963835 RepID=A0A212RV90_9PROT|nr:PIN domain-containing protein [Arboricoccus pini]SNB76636.1 Predicted nucleic acid-binding protein, contains PIN domain [Arboricoccus pini]